MTNNYVYTDVNDSTKRVLAKGDADGRQEVVIVGGGGGGGGSAGGAANGATGQLAANNTSQVLAAARATRRSIALYNESTTQDVRWGYGTVSRTTGMLLPAGRSISIDSTLAIAIINVTDGQAPVVSYAEDYD